MIEDTELLQRYAERQDADAFSELVRRHAGLVYSVSLRVTGNRADAEDAAQECFMDLAGNAGVISSSLLGWLQLRALSRAVDIIRRASARRRYEERTMHRDDEPGRARWQEIAPHVDQALAELPEDLRMPLILHYLVARSQRDIAGELGVNQSTVSRRIDKGLDELRKRLKKAGIVPSVTVLGTLLSENAIAAAPPTLMAALGKMAMAGTRGSATGTAGPTSAVLITEGSTATGVILGTVGAKVAGVLLGGAIAVVVAAAWLFSHSPSGSPQEGSGGPVTEPDDLVLLPSGEEVGGTISRDPETVRPERTREIDLDAGRKSDADDGEAILQQMRDQHAYWAETILALDMKDLEDLIAMYHAHRRDPELGGGINHLQRELLSAFRQMSNERVGRSDWPEAMLYWGLICEEWGWQAGRRFEGGYSYMYALYTAGAQEAQAGDRVWHQLEYRRTIYMFLAEWYRGMQEGDSLPGERLAQAEGLLFNLDAWVQQDDLTMAGRSMKHGISAMRAACLAPDSVERYRAELEAVAEICGLGSNYPSMSGMVGAVAHHVRRAVSDADSGEARRIKEYLSDGIVREATRAQFAVDLAELCNWMQNYEKMREYASAALALLPVGDSPRLELQAAAQIAKAAFKGGDGEGARAHARIAAQLLAYVGGNTLSAYRKVEIARILKGGPL